MRSQPRPPRAAAIALVVVGVLGFLTATGSQAAHSAVLSAGYYKQVLRDTDAIDRTYNEIAGDDSMKGPVENLLGGAVDDDVLGGFLGGFLGGDKGGIGGIADLVPPEIVSGLIQVISPDLLQSLVDAAIDRLIAYLKGGGELVLTLDVTDVIGGVGDVLARDDLKDSPFISEQRQGGQTRQVLGPPEDVRKKIEDSLTLVQAISSNSAWLRFVGLAVLVGALAGVAILSSPDRAAMVRWPGMTLVAGGSAGFVGWLIAKPVFQSLVVDAAFEGGKAPSPAFDRLARDVLNTCVSNITPYIWIPCAVGALAGGILIGLSFMAPRPRAAI